MRTVSTTIVSSDFLSHRNWPQCAECDILVVPTKQLAVVVAVVLHTQSHQYTDANECKIDETYVNEAGRPQEQMVPFHVCGADNAEISPDIAMP